MSYHSPRQSQSQFQFNPSTPPPPPPKPSAQSSRRGTPAGGPPRPPPPPGQSQQDYQSSQSQANPQQQYSNYNHDLPQPQEIPLPEPGWLPSSIKDKSTLDLHHILQTPALQQSLIHDPSTQHPSIPASTTSLSTLLTTNLALATSLQQLESHLTHQRRQTQSRLLSLRALERQWHAKQREQDQALAEFSPQGLYQRLNAAVGEQEALCRGLEESFLEEEGTAGEREVAEFVKRVREARKVATLRRERKERWDEGRVGGWR
ncbi:hypothetical protein K402DRAFT_415821 [Aulographum hederae CBS 113979]|uniref:VPS37 C-terminal domain-containing protein n=1 Tax=Aulographum hederae CBS 113979 TaxID=1176131 RepID=A0A6G1GIX3_9PEZI|nr:hypothetical protein K402DRAFT_415821 [Aulographum hederae CBS 113979]